MIKIAIVDDEEYSAIKCRNIISSAKIPDIQIDIFDDGKHFSKVVFENKEPFDIIILDIDMPEITGFDIAKKLREECQDAIIMFYTAHEQYVFKSFEFQPFRYIRKETAEEELPFALKFAMKKINKNIDRFILIKSDGAETKIKMNCIMYCEKFEHSIDIVMNDNRTYRIRKTLSELYDELCGNRFIYINKGIIVNMKYIEHITQTDVVMENGSKLPISRRSYSEIKAKFSEYVGGLI